MAGTGRGGGVIFLAAGGIKERYSRHARVFVRRAGLSEMRGGGAGARPGVCACLFKKTVWLITPITITHADLAAIAPFSRRSRAVRAPFSRRSRAVLASFSRRSHVAIAVVPRRSLCEVALDRRDLTPHRCGRRGRCGWCPPL